MTDNRTRTVADVRHAFSKYGGNLGTDGSVAFLFRHCGQIVFPPGTSEDRVMEAAIDAGAEDVVSGENGHEIYTTVDSLRDVAKALEAKFGEPRKAAMIWKPKNTVAIDDEKGEQMINMLETLNENDDVQNVYANFEMSDAVVAKMTA